MRKAMKLYRMEEKAVFKIGEGETSEVFSIGGGKVVKLIKKDMYDVNEFESEYKIAKFMGETADFTPKVFDKVYLDSRHGYTMEEISGSLFQDVIDKNPENFSHYAKHFGSAHRKLHNKKISQELESLSYVNEFMREFLNRNQSLPTEINTWLKELLEEIPNKISLLHGDFMPYNIMCQDENLIVIDWAEPSIGSSLHDVARTINFIVDTTSFPKSIMTKNSTAFVKAYLEGYYPDGKVEKDLLHKSFLINAASEIAWAERSGQWDAYSEYLKQLIIENFESNQSIYIDSFKHF
ncbi:phosphotransferase [Vallitalea pronyensis]|uniref:Phosphotransferase n=1 Tax=Vallitalea pronyensis TaxID=1348613 RepID=A0A8J8SI58_9FIRM|nr:aminoglycoside phosphotransferase family protein [Vallitalea pronyensis]QUI24117.1 phosphotransferase [Vallitalea pronyensis]